MSILKAFTSAGRVLQSNMPIVTLTIPKQLVVFEQLRHRNGKHWNPKFRKLRAQKVIKIKLPDLNEKEEELTPEKIRSKMKEKGLLPSKPWMEKPIFIGCTGAIFEAYVPPEGDGKFSAVTAAGAKQKVEFMTKKGKSYFSIRKIKNYDEEFSIGEFEEEAQQIYLKAHTAIADGDEEALRLYVTERAYPEVRHNTLDKTIHWKFVKSLEMPRVVQARSTHVVTKDNVFSQLTVRFHTQQILAVYDRFGRLMHGSEIVKKDVLEYVIFEKHLANEYGSWRIHGKIIPPWMPEREFAERTLVAPPPPPEPEAEEPTPPPTVIPAQENTAPQPNVA